MACLCSFCLLKRLGCEKNLHLKVSFAFVLAEPGRQGWVGLPVPRGCASSLVVQLSFKKRVIQ